MMHAYARAAAGAAAGAGAVPAPAPFEGWSHYVEITVAAAQVASDLTNFPVFVDLSTLPSGFFSAARSDGGDIRVTLADGTTQVPREVVAIDTGAETGELHFLAPSLSSSVDTVFRLYVGNASATEPAVTDTYGRNAVWADYWQVYHGDGLTDSTGNGHTLSAIGNAAAGASGGKLGAAFSLDGTGDRLEGSLEGTDGPLRLSAWCKPTTDTGNGQGVVAAQDIEAGGNESWIRVTAQGNVTNDPLRVQATDQSDVSNTVDVTSISFAAWNYCVGTVDAGGNVKAGLNGGAKSGESSNAPSISPLDTLLIGQWWNLDTYIQPFGGLIDEVRVDPNLRSDDWDAAEHTNQNTPGTFYSVGSLTAN